MPRVLRDLKIIEVSSVDRGAGRGVKILLMKRDAEAMADGGFKITNETDLRAAITKAADATDLNVLAHIAGRAEALGLAALIPATWKRDDNGGDIDMTPEELNKALREGVGAVITDALKPISERLEKAETELRLAKMTDAHKAFMAGLDSEDAKKAFGACADDTARNAFMDKNPPVKKNAPVLIDDLAKRDKVIADLSASNADLAKRMTAIDLEKAQTSFKKQAVDMGLTEADGETMRKAYSGDATAQTELNKRFAEVTAALKKQVDTGVLFGEFGTRKAATGSGMAGLEAKAEELLKTEAGKGLTKEQAFAKVYEDPANTDLRKQEINERSKRLHVVAA